MKLSPLKTPFKLSLGQRGEMLAWEYLRKQGYEILHKNYRCKLGEIDIVAKKDKRLCFFEVKTRTSEQFGLPEEAVGTAKQIKLIRLAEWYLKEKKLKDPSVSFNVLAIDWSDPSHPVFRLLSHAFDVEEANTF